MKKLALPLALIGTLAATVAVFVPGAMAAKNTCSGPSTTPAAGSKVNGGLEVTGTCIALGVTVNGGLTVDATGAVSFQSGTVNGGVSVSPGGELDMNASTNGVGAPTGTTATVNGGVTINNAHDVDLLSTTINGPLTVAGVDQSYSRPGFCGNSVSGPASISDVGSVFGSVVGGAAFGCPGNTFNSLSLTNSTVFIGGNTIAHDLSCATTFITVLEPNSIGGTNTCY